MKIAMPELGGEVNQHFGRSNTFAVIEIENGQVVNVETISASGLEHNHGGIAGLLKAKGVETVITGGVGQGMFDALQQSGFEVIRGASGTIKAVAEAYAGGKLVSKGEICNHHDH